LRRDFNLPQINWTNVESASDSLRTQFIDCIQENALTQYVEDVTRSKITLDLVLTNDPFLIHDVNVSVPFSTIDHNKVEFKLNCYSTVLIHSIEKVFVDYIVNWDGLNNDLCNVNWSESYAVNDNRIRNGLPVLYSK